MADLKSKISKEKELDTLRCGIMAGIVLDLFNQSKKKRLESKIKLTLTDPAIASAALKIVGDGVDFFNSEHQDVLYTTPKDKITDSIFLQTMVKNFTGNGTNDLAITLEFDKAVLAGKNRAEILQAKSVHVECHEIGFIKQAFDLSNRGSLLELPEMEAKEEAVLA